MKKILTTSLLSALYLAILSSCVSQKEMGMNERAIAREVKLYADIEDRSSTKVDDSGFCNGDSFGVFVVNHTDENTPGVLFDQGNQADNVQYTYNASDNVWTPKKEVYYKDATTKVNIYGYYPYDSSISNVHSYAFAVSTDQRKDANPGQMSGYEASDFLYGKAENIVPSEQTVSILFKHKMSSVSVTLIKGDGWESDNQWLSASKDILINNTVVNSVVDLESGNVTPTGEVSQLGIVPKPLNGDTWKAVVVPQIIQAGKGLVTVTINGMVSLYTKDVEYQYYQGKLNTITLSVSKKLVGEGIVLKLVAESIVPWDDIEFESNSRDYIVIHCPEAGKLEETILSEGYDLSSIRNLKVTGEINSPDFYVMKTKMDILEALNLADVKIKAFEKDEYEWLEPISNKEDCIPIRAFTSKLSLNTIVFPNQLTEIGSYSFSGSGLKGTLVIPEGVVRIDDNAFSEIPSLNAQVVFPSTLRELEAYAFNNTNIRGELRLPNLLKKIGEYCFSRSSISGNLHLPDSLEFMGFGSFNQCKGLTGSLIIPERIKEIPNGCFGMCGLGGFDSGGGELVLNEGLEKIGSNALDRCNFSGPLILPQSLKSIETSGLEGNNFSSLIIKSSSLRIGDRAFWCSIQGGALDIPEGITSIGQSAFVGCHFESIRFPNSLEYIGASAFESCYYLSQIECEPNNPPQLGTGAFNGVPKDNFTVVVPESSVEDYQSAPGWNEFKRIEAKRDFSISRRLYRTLNVANEKSFTLRAASGATWSIQNKPDWVTVEPMSGTGKTEVKVTVSELPPGSSNRYGDIVYALDNDGYTVSTTVEQYDYQYGDGDVIVNHNHLKGSGINLIFMGDGYDAKDISEGKYLDNINEAIGYLFDIEPYKSYKDYFNISIVVACSEESGIQYANIIRDTKFNTTYTQKNGLEANEDICDHYSSLVSNSLTDKCHVTLICNTNQFIGRSYLYPDKRSISICPVVNSPYPYDFRGIVQHEVGGHGFGKLGDENILVNEFLQSTVYYYGFLAAKSYGWYDNLSLVGNIMSVPWSHMIFDPDYADIVDVYEGGYFCSRGVFRSESNSCMNNYIPYFSSISRESIVRRIMDYAGESFSYESFKEKDVKTSAVASAPATNHIISNN